jgi:hypothetical protein
VLYFFYKWTMKIDLVRSSETSMYYHSSFCLLLPVLIFRHRRTLYVSPKRRVTSILLHASCLLLALFFDTDDGGSIFLRNVGVLV